jgi:hypothetical protein
MLKFSILSTASGMTLKLYSMLDGPRVDELERCWQILRMTRGERAMCVDLADVKHVGRRGEELLAAMRRDGIVIVEGARQPPMVLHRPIK